MSDLPEPLVPADVDLRGFKFMPLDVIRLGDSDLFALSTGDEFKAAVALWCKSWLQAPAGSLPDDDRILAHLSGAGARWRKVKAMAMRGWIKCADGRLYHPVVAEKAVEAWASRQEATADREANAEKLRRWREAKKRLRNPTANEDVTVTEPVREPLPNGTVTSLTGTGTGTVNTPPLREGGARAGEPGSGHARTIPADWQPDQADRDWIAYAKPDLAPADVERELTAFRLHAAERGITTFDRSASFRRWMQRAKPEEPADAPYVPLSQRIDLAKLTGSKP